MQQSLATFGRYQNARRLRANRMYTDRKDRKPVMTFSSRVLLIALSVALGVVVSVRAEPADADTCTTLETFQARAEPDTGKMLDQITRNGGVFVLCGTKSVTFKKFLLVNADSLRSGWEGRKAEQWNQIYCQGPWAEIVAQGWSVAVEMHTLDGTRFWHAAECLPKAD